MDTKEATKDKQINILKCNLEDLIKKILTN
jgi:hypothetical protein